MKYVYYWFVALVALGTLTFGVWFAMPGVAALYLTGIFFIRHMRIREFSDGGFEIFQPEDRTIEYSSIRSIVNLAPYDYKLHWLLVIYKQGFLLEKFNMAWIPADQDIIEHLKAHGVKVRNFWFWQEKD